MYRRQNLNKGRGGKWSSGGVMYIFRKKWNIVRISTQTCDPYTSKGWEDALAQFKMHSSPAPLHGCIFTLLSSPLLYRQWFMEAVIIILSFMKYCFPSSSPPFHAVFYGISNSHRKFHFVWPSSTQNSNSSSLALALLVYVYTKQYQFQSSWAKRPSSLSSFSPRLHALLLQPNRPFHDFWASKSGDWRILRCSETLIDGFRGYTFLKRSIGQCCPKADRSSSIIL